MEKTNFQGCNIKEKQISRGVINGKTNFQGPIVAESH